MSHQLPNSKSSDTLYMEINGTPYYVASKEGVPYLYDIDTREEVGYWSSKKGQYIMFSLYNKMMKKKYENLNDSSESTSDLEIMQPKSESDSVSHTEEKEELDSRSDSDSGSHTEEKEESESDSNSGSESGSRKEENEESRSESESDSESESVSPRTKWPGFAVLWYTTTTPLGWPGNTMTPMSLHLERESREVKLRKTL